jgi:hypothetical protein
VNCFARASWNDGFDSVRFLLFDTESGKRSGHFPRFRRARPGRFI